MANKLQALADARGVRDPLRINVWAEEEGEPVNMPGRVVPIKYHRADGRLPGPALPPLRPRR